MFCWFRLSWMKSWSCDRVAVMYRGRIIAIVPNKGITKEYIGLLMAGVVPEEPIQFDESTVVEATF